MTPYKRSEEQLDTFSWNLYAIRMNKGLTQEKLEEMSWVAAGQISRLEQGRCGAHMKTALLLCNALGVDITEMFEKRVELILPLKQVTGRPSNRKGRNERL